MRHGEKVIIVLVVSVSHIICMFCETIPKIELNKSKWQKCGLFLGTKGVYKSDTNFFAYVIIHITKNWVKSKLDT